MRAYQRIDYPKRTNLTGWRPLTASGRHSLSNAGAIVAKASNCLLNGHIPVTQHLSSELGRQALRRNQR
jgi:hypothetical protein